MNGEMIGELRRMAASEDLETNTAIRLLLSAQAELIDCQKNHRHDEYSLVGHAHEDKYSQKEHAHPWAVIAATVATIGTTVLAIWAMLKP